MLQSLCLSRYFHEILALIIFISSYYIILYYNPSMIFEKNTTKLHNMCLLAIACVLRTVLIILNALIIHFKYSSLIIHTFEYCPWTMANYSSNDFRTVVSWLSCRSLYYSCSVVILSIIIIVITMIKIITTNPVLLLIFKS